MICLPNKTPAFCLGKKDYISNSCLLAAMADLQKFVASGVGWLFSDLVLTQSCSLFVFFFSSLSLYVLVYLHVFVWVQNREVCT